MSYFCVNKNINKQNDVSNFFSIYSNLRRKMTDNESSSKNKTETKNKIDVEHDDSDVMIDRSRKNNFLSLKDKAEILQRLDQGALASNLAREYGISKSTISRFKKKKDCIRKAVTTTFPNNTERRTMRGTLYKETEAALYQWYSDQKQKNIKVTSSMLQKKARILYNECEVKNYSFSASVGWLRRFKRRYGIELNDTISNGIETSPVASGQMDEPMSVNHTSISKKFTQSVDKKEAIRSVDTVIRWSIENSVDSLYLTMLRSLKNQIKDGSKAKYVHKGTIKEKSIQ